MRPFIRFAALVGLFAVGFTGAAAGQVTTSTTIVVDDRRLVPTSTTIVVDDRRLVPTSTTIVVDDSGLFRRAPPSWS
jgi:hypothetical protein